MLRWVPNLGFGKKCSEATVSASVEEDLSEAQRLAKRQNAAITLSQRVLAEVKQEAAIEALTAAVKELMDCDRVGFYLLVQEGRLVCLADAAGGTAGHIVVPGEGIVGRVALSGKTVNIPDAQKDPDFDQAADTKSGLTTRSVLCVGLTGVDGNVVAVLEAVNKKANDGIMDRRASWHAVTPTAEGRTMPFTWMDEQALRLLLSLTYPQIRSLKVDTCLALVGHLSTTVTDMDKCMLCTMNVIRSQINCQHAAILLRDGRDIMYCARSKKSNGTGEFCEVSTERLRMQVEGTGTVGEILRSGKALTLDDEHDSIALKALWSALWGTCEAETPMSRESGFSCDSAIVHPLQISKGTPFGVFVAMNKVYPNLDNSPRRHLPGVPLPRRLSSFLEDAGLSAEHYQPTVVPTEETAAPEMVRFNETDVKQLDVLLSYAVHALHAAQICHSQNLKNQQLRALIDMCSESVNGMQKGKVHDIIYALCDHGRELFYCDRCSFFAVEPWSEELMGYFIPPGGYSLQTLRVKKAGIVGLAVKQGCTLNIEDAWNDPRFSKETDLKTGYRTKTILCCPIKINTGQVVAALQCVNKRAGRVFDDEDFENFETVAQMFSGIISRHMSEAAMESLMESDEVHDDVKASLAQIGFRPLPEAGGVKMFWQKTDRRDPRRRGTFERSFEDMQSLLKWDFDISTIHQSALPGFVAYSLDRFNLMGEFNIERPVLDDFVRNIRDDYRDNPYHNWAHAVVTFHISCILLLHIAAVSKDANGGELLHVDRLALLLAALGHDAGHRGMTNAFETASFSELAMRYNDQSPLENHHAAITCGRLQRSEPALTAGMAVNTLKRLRAIIIHAILYTDMARHNESVIFLREQVLGCSLKDEQAGENFSRDSCGALLHCADVSHPVLPWASHRRHSLLACKEFFTQFQEETKMGLPTLPFMGKDPDGPIKELGSLQSGFLSFVVVPLWTALNHFMKDEVKHTIQNVQHNKTLWDKIAEGEEVEDKQPFHEGIPRADSFPCPA